MAHCLLSFPFSCIPWLWLEWTWHAYSSLFWCTMSSSSIFSNLCHCGNLIHSQLLSHPSMGLSIPAVALQVILWTEVEYFCRYLYLYAHLAAFLWVQHSDHHNDWKVYVAYIALAMNSLAALLNNNVTGLRNPDPMGIDHICSKVRYLLVLISKHIWTLYIPLPIHFLVIAWWWHGIVNVKVLAEFLEPLWTKVCFWHQCTRKPLFYKIILHIFIKLWALNSSICFITQNLLWWSTIHK